MDMSRKRNITGATQAQDVRDTFLTRTYQEMEESWLTGSAIRQAGKEVDRHTDDDSVEPDHPREFEKASTASCVDNQDWHLEEDEAEETVPEVCEPAGAGI